MLARILPFLGWFKGYTGAAFRVDLVAGVTVALVLIPQSMAYAQLAGLPAYYGLYAAFLPPMVAAMFGSSMQLATGPVAIVSLMTAASLEPLATAGSEAFIAYAVLLALIVGVFQLALGVLRLGLVVNFLSHPVVNGFTNAAAIIIASSQLSKMFGVYVDKAPHHYETIWRVLEGAVHYTHWPSLAMGVGAFIIMAGLKRLNPKIPYVLVAVAVTTLISWAIGFQHDAQVSLEAIQSPQVRSQIQAYNQEVKRINALGQERADINVEARKAAETKGDQSLDVMKLHQQASMDTAKIELEKGKAHLLRETLRGYIFVGVEHPDGRMSFYPEGQAPEGVKGDGRVWRIMVGNRGLDQTKLRMAGGGAVVADIPPGLPTLSAPTMDWGVIMQLFPYAVIISLLGFMEAISIAKAMAAKTGQRLDPNQELIGQGLANMIGCLGKSYPVSGSFSRSAVNLQAGAQTGLSSVVTGLMVVIVLLFFTPLLYHLPQAVLAAVIMMAVVGLINVSGFVHAWKAQWYDGVISIITFIGTLIFAPHLDKGIMIGVVLSLMVFLYKSMRPRVAKLSMHEDCSLRDAEHYHLAECEHVAVVRFDGPLFFANASFLEDQINERIREMPKLRHILVVANGINDIDASGEDTLSLLVDQVRSAGYDISFSHLKENVLEAMQRTHLLAKIGEDHVYPLASVALSAIHESAHMDSDEQTCPLLNVCPLEEVHVVGGDQE
ncbi:MAG: STAS domain-containing protein [Desulfarculaceae bacterium]|nr:STAS domain-containing protein [Desulfarculaceae bacterium]MCF8072852.1 STAS domain-containing protein [Desulfarculaceae bacterium]MCF8101020.1 STAS domain-containing protein [Desulfarculaceae bacterium]MCF8115593.1 STAS domain-containing protein [Desulfarculaceae bacterium]